MAGPPREKGWTLLSWVPTILAFALFPCHNSLLDDEHDGDGNIYRYINFCSSKIRIVGEGIHTDYQCEPKVVGGDLKSQPPTFVPSVTENKPLTTFGCWVLGAGCGVYVHPNERKQRQGGNDIFCSAFSCQPTSTADCSPLQPLSCCL